MQQVVCQRSTFNNKLWIQFYIDRIPLSIHISMNLLYFKLLHNKKEKKLVEQIWKWLLVVGECLHRLNFHKIRLFRTASNTLGVDKRRPLGFELQSLRQTVKSLAKQQLHPRERGGLQNRVTNISDNHSYYKAELFRDTQEIKYTALDIEIHRK